jgi:hypothetical protein
MKFRLKNGKGEINIFADAVLATGFIFFMMYGIFSLTAFRIFEVFGMEK